jgi:transcriptional regulator with XRE-family HTH domain
MAKDPRHSSPLRKIRLQHGLTQSQLAEIAGVEPKTVQRWESGTNSPRLFSIQRLCAYFNATPADLGLLDTDQPHEESQETRASIPHHSEDKASPDRQPCCCLLLMLLGSLLGTGGLVLAAGKRRLLSSSQHVQKSAQV